MSTSEKILLGTSSATWIYMIVLLLHFADPLASGPNRQGIRKMQAS